MSSELKGKRDITETVAYKLLSMAISYPEKEIANAITSGWLFENLKNFFKKKSDRELIESMENDFYNIEDLQVIYTTKFDLKISLYETHYVVKNAQPEERAKFLLSLEKFYNDEGVELTDRDMPDYLPTLLEFAHYLSSENRTEKLSIFTKTHLKTWIPELNRKVQDENVKFYKYVIQLIENFILV